MATMSGFSWTIFADCADMSKLLNWTGIGSPALMPAWSKSAGYSLVPAMLETTSSEM